MAFDSSDPIWKSKDVTIRQGEVAVLSTEPTGSGSHHATIMAAPHDAMWLSNERRRDEIM